MNKKIISQKIMILLLLIIIFVSGCTQSASKELTEDTIYIDDEMNEKDYILNVTDIIFTQRNFMFSNNLGDMTNDPNSKMQCIQIRVTIEDAKDNNDRISSLNVPDKFKENHKDIISFMDNIMDALNIQYECCKIFDGDTNNKAAMNCFYDAIENIMLATNTLEKKIGPFLESYVEKYPDEFKQIQDKHSLIP